MTDQSSSRAARAPRTREQHAQREVRQRARRTIDRETFDQDLAELEAALIGQLQNEDAPPIAAANDDGDAPAADAAGPRIEDVAPVRRKAARARRAPPRAENRNDELPPGADPRDQLRAFEAQARQGEEPSLAPSHPVDLDEEFARRAPLRARRPAPERRRLDDRPPPHVRPEVKQRALVTQALRFGATVFSIMALIGVSALLVLLAIGGGERPDQIRQAGTPPASAPPATERAEAPATTGSAEGKADAARVASIGQTPARATVRAADPQQASAPAQATALETSLPAPESNATPQLERDSAQPVPRSSDGPFSPPPTFRERADERPAAQQAAEPRAMAAAPATPAARPAAPAAARPAAAAPAAPAPTRSASVTSYVNMRATADNDGAVVVVVPAGKKVNVVECKGWCEVVYEDKKGFIHQRFLKE